MFQFIFVVHCVNWLKSKGEWDKYSILTHAHLDRQLLFTGRLHQVPTDLHHSLFVFTGQHGLPQQRCCWWPDENDNQTGVFRLEVGSNLFCSLMLAGEMTVAVYVCSEWTKGSCTNKKGQHRYDWTHVSLIVTLVAGERRSPVGRLRWKLKLAEGTLGMSAVCVSIFLRKDYRCSYIRVRA